MKKVLITSFSVLSLLFFVSACAPRHHKSCGQHKDIKAGCCAKKECPHKKKKKCDCKKCQEKKAECPHSGK